MINPYSLQELQHSKERFEDRVTTLYKKLFCPLFSAEEQQAFANIHLEFPLVSELGNPGPLDFYASSKDGVLSMPILSLLFFEELCTANAWLYVNQFNLDTIDEYSAMLKYVPPGGFEDGQYPKPLIALYIPDDALSDSAVDSLSLRFRNSGYAFILAHELGHLFLQHRGDMRFRKEMKAQEEEADRYAIGLLKRGSIFPMGAVLWFQANAYHLPHRGDFRTDKEWKDYLERRATHPVTPRRLFALSEYLQEHHAEFSENEADAENFRFIANGINHIAETLNDEELQLYMASRVNKLRPGGLRPRPLRAMGD